MKTIVVYYSLEGNTEFAAGKIAEVMGADLLRLYPKKAYPSKGFRKFLWGGKSAVMAETPVLEAYTFDAAAYDCVILGFPVWASNMTPPIRTFLKENDLQGKRLAAFACQSGNGAEKALDKIKELTGRSSLEAELVLIDPKSKPAEDNEQKIRDFCAKLSDES